MAKFGEMLRDWRQRRRLSQLSLALEADVSARHLSFLETGRSHPSRGMVLRLGEALEMPRAVRNQLLDAAGFAPAFEARAQTSADVAPLQAALTWTLARHAPYPGIALDRQWRLVAMNAPAKTLFGAAGVAEGDSLLEALLENAALRGTIENLAHVERLTLARLRTELAHFGSDAVLEAAISKLQARLAGSDVATESPDPLPAVIGARYRMGGQVLSFFSTLAQFGGTEDIAMADLRIELYFPADNATGQILQGLADAGSA